MLQTVNQFQVQPDISGAITQGLQTGQQFAQNSQQSTIRANQFDQVKAQQARDEKVRMVKSVANAAVKVQNLPDTASKSAFLTSRVQEINERGGDSKDTQEALDLYNAGDIEAGDALINSVVKTARETGFLQASSGDRGTQTASKRDFATFQQLQATADETQDPNDISAAKQFGRQAGFVRSTEQEKADIKVDESTRKEVAKANVARRQGYIDNGIQAADTTANLRRSIDLLETVATGGFDNVALKAKQLFGIEGADELELSTNLGKNVLAQLKPIFGAAFTAKEGEELKKIESGFGRSTAGNKRLLKNALKIADRSARRGIAAAEDQGDAFTAGEIKEALNFELDAKPSTPENTEKSGGKIMVDASGNRAMVYDDGTFKEM